jgi:hypothetical protein
MALFEEPILFCKFSIDNPLTADVLQTLLLTGRISAKTTYLPDKAFMVKMTISPLNSLPLSTNSYAQLLQI